MLKVLSVFGTRPEAIKMAPLVQELAKFPEKIVSKVAVTAQHREMLDQVLELFAITPDYDLDIMSKGQTLTQITTRALQGLTEVYAKERPDLVLVHGDTSTTFVASLAAFYSQIAVGHVEAGLRTYNKYSPYPEEMNRQLTGVMADFHFAPTKMSKENLLRENKNPERIIVTGNTVIDSLLQTVRADFLLSQIPGLSKFDEKNRLVLVTSHRRENLGEPMEHIFSALKEIIEEFDDVEIVFPMHKNPKVRESVYAILGGMDRVHLIEPLDYEPFVNLINKSYLVLTDSGGLQEESPSLGKPVLVLRDTTERPEAVLAGTVKLVGTDQEKIYAEASKLLRDGKYYNEMANAVNPYGDGKASQRIVQSLLYHYGLDTEQVIEYI